MLSRIAEDLFWLGRYVERAENVARFLDVHYHARLERGAPGDEGTWESIVAVSGDLPLFQGRYGAFTEDNVLTFLVTDPRAPNSIVSCLARARENARGIRDHLSVEMWEELNKFYLFVRERRSAAGETDDGPHTFLQQVKTRAYLFAGVAEATMLRDEGWEFLRAGTFLERLSQTARLTSIQARMLLRPGVGSPHRWIALLKSCSAFEAYRRVFASGFAPDRVLELLLLHPEFPRSAYFGATRLCSALRSITGTGADRFATRSEREAARLWNRLGVATIDDVRAEGPPAFIAEIIAAGDRIGLAIAADFFAGLAATTAGAGQ